MGKTNAEILYNFNHESMTYKNKNSANYRKKEAKLKVILYASAPVLVLL